jgi:hypothetical protein
MGHLVGQQWPSASAALSNATVSTLRSTQLTPPLLNSVSRSCWGSPCQVMTLSQGAASLLRARLGGQVALDVSEQLVLSPPYDPGLPAVTWVYDLTARY